LKINDLTNLVKLLGKHRVSVDYTIECSSGSTIIRVLNNELKQTIGSEVEIEAECVENTCVTPRILSIRDYTRYLHELISATILSRILSCKCRVKLIVVYDTWDRDFHVLVYLNKLFKQHGLNIDVHEYRDYVFKLLEFKNIYNRVRDLQRVLKHVSDDRSESEYRMLLSVMDRMLVEIKDLWLGNPDLFDRIYKIILGLEQGVEEIAENTGKSIELYLGDYREVLKSWMDSVEKLIMDYNVEYKFIDSHLDLGVREYGLNNTLNSLVSYLRRQCGRIVFVNGEEYGVVLKMLNIDEYVDYVMV